VPPDGSEVQSLKNEVSEELSFVVARSPDDQSVADELQKQLESAGFARCDSTSLWQSISDGTDSQSAKRLVRFLVRKNENLLVTIAVTQRCNANTSTCQQTALVKQSHFPPEVADRDQIIAKICSGALVQQ
jgi:hypothetical protein